MVVGALVSKENLLVSGVVVMQLLVEERVLETLRQHDLRVGEHCAVANAVVRHHKVHLEIPTDTRNELIILLCFFYCSQALIKIKLMSSFFHFHKFHN